MFIWYLKYRVFVILSILNLLVGQVAAQLYVVPAINSCTCDGSITFTTSMAGSVFFELSDGNGSVVASDINSNGSVTFSNLCPEVFIVTASANGSTETAVTNISAGNINPGNAIATSICSTNGPIQLSSFIPGLSPGGNWTNPLGDLMDGTIQPSTATAGLYVYSLLSGGCTISTGVLVSIIQNANPGLSTTYLICENYSPFFMTNLLAGTPDPGGQWFAAGGVPMNGWFSPAIMNSGLFTYMIDTVAGCSPVFSTLNVVENLIPNPGINTTILVCSNAAPFSMVGQMQGFPDSGGTWYNSSNAVVSNTFNPALMPAGVYRYHLNAATPCVDQDAYLTISYTNTNPSGSSGSISVCINEASFDMMTFLGGNPLAGGVWYNPLNQVVSNIFNPQNQVSGNYTYQYPSVGCSPASVILNVSVEALPNAGPDQTVTICENLNSFNLNSTLPGGTLTSGIWSSGGISIGSTIVPGAPGNYNYTYTLSGTECPSDAADLILEIVSLPQQPLNQTLLLCESNNPVDLASLYPDFSQLQFQNSDGIPLSNLFDPSVQGTTTVTVIHSLGNGCPSLSAEIEITVDEIAFENLQMNETFCESEGIIDLNTFLDGINPSNGNWFDANANEVSNSVSLYVPGGEVYSFTQENGSVCPPSIIEITIYADAAVSAGLNGSIELCINDPAIALSQFISPDATAGGYWELNGSPFISSTFDPSTDAEGVYHYTIEPNGMCIGDQNDVQISVDEGITVNVGEDLFLCTGEGSPIIGDLSQPGYSYSWTPSTNLNSPLQSQTTLNSVSAFANPNEVEYTLVADNGVCVMSDVVLVTIYPLPIINSESIIELCEGQGADLQASGGVSYDWQPATFFSNPNSSQPGFLPIAPGTYNAVAEAINSWGCASQMNLEITIHPNPQLNLVSQTFEGCAPLAINETWEIGATDVASAIWQIGPIMEVEDTLNGFLYNEGFYDLHLEVASEFGCVSSFDISNFAHVFPAPVPEFSYLPLRPTTINNEVTLTNESMGGESYVWKVNEEIFSEDESPILVLPENQPGNYFVCLYVTSENGCMDSACKIIHLDNEHLLWVPNSFSPDNDGINDVFKPILLGFDEDTYTLSIVDRWGVTVFQTNDPERAWVGNILGGNYFAEPDLYVWLIVVKDKEKAEYQRYRGHITLIR